MKYLPFIAISSLALATLGWAQERTGGSSGGSPTRRGPDVPSLAPITANIAGEILQVDTERTAIQIRSKPKGTLLGLVLDPKCEIKADKKQFGKKELTLEELAPGQLVELTVRRADMHVIEMKVKKSKSESVSEKPMNQDD